MKKINLTCLNGVLAALFIIAFSIGIPIYCRFLYYIQIDTLNIPSASGYSREVIRTAYDETLNYLTVWGTRFGTGSLSCSQEAAAHFRDCKTLFLIQQLVFLFSLAGMTALKIAERKGYVALTSKRGFCGSFYAGIAVVTLAVTVVILMLSVDFERAFEGFHAIFFPGKTNWVFNPEIDEIINILPEEFFMNCAITIGVFLVAASALLIANGIIRRRAEGKQTPLYT